MGLAQALIGNPPLLILDEPTVGLDPNQIIEIRALIKKLGEKHTIILSSHILSEVNAICDYVLIIDQGLLVAEDTPEHLSEHFADKNRILAVCQGRAGALIEDRRWRRPNTLRRMTVTGEYDGVLDVTAETAV